MPTVPTYDSFQVAANTLPQPRIDAPQMMDVAGAQLQQMGAGLSRAGDATGAIANDMAQKANQLRVDDALNRIKEEQLRLTYDRDAGYTNVKGINALERQSGKPLADEYGDLLKERITSVAGSLVNDIQRQMFVAHAQNMLTSFRGQAMAHEAQEFKTYSLSVSEGIQKTATDEIGLNWNNPEVVGKAIERIRAETYRQAQLLGKAAEWQEAQAKGMVSNGHTVALMAALKANKPDYAQAYLKKFAKDMNGDDILKVQGHITEAMNTSLGMSRAAAVIQQFAPRFATGDTERAFNILLGTESGNRQLAADGQPITSAKGAIGIAQVMPGTAPEAAKLAGLPFDENRYRTDANYNKALGMAYFQKQLQDFGGDLAKAYAAYNAGPGALRSAMAAEKNPKNDTGKSWLDFMPAETKNYVAKNMAAFSSGQGREARPTMLDIDNALRSDPALAANPAAYKAARADAEKQFHEIEQAKKTREDDLLAEAQRQLIATKGDFNSLPTNLKAEIPPGRIDDLMAFAGKMAAGQPVKTDYALYYQLKLDPRLLGQTNLMALRDKLGDADFKALAEEQQNIRAGKGETALRSTRDVLNNFMQQAGIDPTPKDADKAGAEKVGRIWNEFEARVREREREKGSTLTHDEREKVAAQMFTKVGVQRSFWFDTEKPAALLDKTDQIKIPDADRQQIVAALKAAGKAVTPETIAALYLRRLGKS